MKNFSYLYLLIFLISSCSQLSDEDEFGLIIESEWQRGIEENPLRASAMGILDNNDKWPSYSLNDINDDHNHNVDILNKLKMLKLLLLNPLLSLKLGLNQKKYHSKNQSFPNYWMIKNQLNNNTAVLFQVCKEQNRSSSFFISFGLNFSNLFLYLINSHLSKFNF